MELSDLAPQPGERAILLGMTGSGKTTLAKTLLLRSPQRVLVFDYKHTFEPFWQPEEYAILCEPEAIPDAIAGGHNVIYRPDAESQSPADSERVLRWVFLQGDLCLYIDDLHIVCESGTKFPPSLRHISTLGREKLITAVYSTQRPVSIPRVALSEANHNFVFVLNHPDDRAIAAGLIGPEGKIVPGKYQFWYKRDGVTEPAVQYRVRLGG